MEHNPLGRLSPEGRQHIEQPGYVPQGGARIIKPSSGPTAPAWAHWDYYPDEWAVFDQVDWEAVRNTSLLALILSPITYLVIMGVLWALFASSTPREVFSFIMLFPGIILLTGLGFVMGAAAISLKEAKKRYQARHQPAGSPRVTLGSDGVWEAGTYFPFKVGLWGLKSVKVTANPTVLHFKLDKLNLHGSWNAATKKLRVLVPRGHEAEAEWLRQQYYSLVIAPWKTPSNFQPPEPM